MLSGRSTLLAAGALALVLSSAALPSNATTSTAQPKAHSQTTVSTSAGSLYTPVTPVRLLDTRATTKIQSYGTLSVAIPTDEIPADTTSVVLNLTGLDSAGATTLTVTPQTGSTFPYVVPNLDLAAGEVRANEVTVEVGGAAGATNRSVMVSAGNAAADAIVDLEGYYAPNIGSGFTSLTPQRVLDTRDGTGTGGASGPVGSGQTITLDLSSVLPAGATAAVFNLTAVNPTDQSFITAWSAGQSRPGTSNLNVAPGTITPNLVTVGLNTDRKVSLYNDKGQTDLIADLAGYYSPDSTQVYYGLDSLRALDTRDGNGNSVDPIGTNADRTVGLSGWLPANASSAVVNLTGTNATASTYLTAWPVGQNRPATSNLNPVPGQTAANLAIVSLGTGGGIDLYNSTGNVDVVVDLFGYFAPRLAPCTANCVVGFGENSSGRLANGGSSILTQTATAAFGLSDVTQVTGSTFNGYALRADGTVWAWGNNGFGELGNGTSGRAEDPTPEGGNSGVPFSSPVPVQVHGLSDIVAIAPELALRSDGTVWSWGDNAMYELGNGNTDASFVATTPVQVSGLTNVAAIARDQYNGFALTSDGKVWDWGQDIEGNLGNGTSGTPFDCKPSGAVSPAGPNCASAVPVQVSNLTGVTKLGIGQAVTSDGHVWQWGPDGVTQNFTPIQNNTPVQVQGLSNVTALAQIANDEPTSYALESDGTVWSWGFNSDDGEYGNGTTCRPGGICYSDVPVQVSGLTNATAIAAGEGDLAGYALTSDGTVWAWGGGGQGALGTGNGTESSAVPQRVPGLFGVTAIGDYGYSVVPSP